MEGRADRRWYYNRFRRERRAKLRRKSGYIYFIATPNDESRFARKAAVKPKQTQIERQEIYSIFAARAASTRKLFYHLISGEADPATALMLKEENQQEAKWKRLDRRVEWAESIDINEAHIQKLAATAPYRNVKRKRVHSVISKHSPERGITQRHVKMSPMQYV
jgi:hypothetical protein